MSQHNPVPVDHGRNLLNVKVLCQHYSTTAVDKNGSSDALQPVK